MNCKKKKNPNEKRWITQRNIKNERILIKCAKQRKKKHISWFCSLLMNSFHFFFFLQQNFLRFSTFFSSLFSFLIRGVLPVSKVLMLISNLRIYISLACKPNHFYRPFGRVAHFHFNFFLHLAIHSLTVTDLNSTRWDFSIKWLVIFVSAAVARTIAIKEKKHDTQQQTNSRDLFSVVMV